MSNERSNAYISYRRRSFYLHISGAGELRRTGVQNLHCKTQQQTGTEGDPLSKPFIQILVLIHQGVVPRGAVHVDPSWTKSWEETFTRQREEVLKLVPKRRICRINAFLHNRATFVAFIRDFAQIYEVSTNGNIVDFVRISDLYLHPFTQWWEHLSEDYLLVPHGFIAALLYRCLPLQHKEDAHFMIGGRCTTSHLRSGIEVA